MGKLFGTDGIRGRVNVHPLTAELALNLGRAVVHVFARAGHRPRIIIGKDTRLSGDMLEAAVAAGVCSMGGTAITVGIMPTPGIAYLASSMRADAGIVISASHNPHYDNGFKIFSREGFKLPDDAEATIEELLLNTNTLHAHLPNPEDLGQVQPLTDAVGRYIVFLKGTFPRSFTLEGLTLVLDCAHGATTFVAPATFAELGARVITIHNAPDGRNINVACGSQYPHTLSQEVIRHGAAAGFAFDGDGDRVTAVDERGELLTGDRIMLITAKWLKEMGRLEKDLVVCTVMSNLGLTLALSQLGITSLATDVGDRNVLEAMLKEGAVLGGEDSGHVIYLQHHTSGDGIITALQLLAAMKAYDQPLSSLAQWMTVFPQVLINVEVKSRRDLSRIPEIMAVIKQTEARLGNRGRVLVRYSGTQNLCRVMVEGPTEEETREAAQTIAQVVEKHLGVGLS